MRGARRIRFTAILAVCLVAAVAHADDDGHGHEQRCSALTITSTRDLSFGRATIDDIGAVDLSPEGIAQYSGGARRVTGDLTTARFMVSSDARAANGAIVIGLPQEFSLTLNGRRLRVDRVRAILDGEGRDWRDLGAGRYQCTLSATSRCAFAVGARLNLSRSDGAGNGEGALLASASTLLRCDDRHGDDEHEDDERHDHGANP